MTIQIFLKAKIAEAGISQAEVAKRIGWSEQNVSYKLTHQNTKFSSMLLIAEGIGLSCKIEDANDLLADYTEDLIRAACNTGIYTETFSSLIESTGCKLAFGWKKPGDILYMYNPDKNESGT